MRKRPPTKGSFKKGQRWPRQGGNRGGGRPTNAERERLARERAQSEEFKKNCSEYAMEQLLVEIDPVLKTYVHHAKGKKSPTTTRHFIDKIIPPLSRVEAKRDVVFVTSLPLEEI